MFETSSKSILDGKMLDDKFFERLCEKCSKNDLSDDLYEVGCFELCHIIRTQIAPKFWNFFKIDYEYNLNNLNIKESKNLFENFDSAINFLFLNFISIRKVLKRLQLLKVKYEDTTNLQFLVLEDVYKTTLLGQLPPDFQKIVFMFYSIALKGFSMNNQNLKSSDVNCTILNEDFCLGCDLNETNCSCKKFSDISCRVNEKLIEMDLLDCISGQTITLIIQERIINHINCTSQGIFDKSHLKELLLWLNTDVLNWLRRVFRYEKIKFTKNNYKTRNALQSFEVKLTYFIYENFAYNIVDQFFNIIIDFPDSIPAIDDLKICMEKIDLKNYLIRNLKSSLEARILHPGVNTMDILTGYVAAIKAIRYLDCSGLVLEAVTAPIRDYLRKRTDTVRRVVTALTEDGPTDLSEELAKAEKLKKNMNLILKEELENWENWQPDPFNTLYICRNKKLNLNRSADIIAMIIEIYGSKELFVNEYRNLMADRLITSLDFCSEKELRNLELLKLRFGDSLLHSCEVMLKDVADSKRINIHIQNDKAYNENKSFDISTLIVSAQFWPSFNKEYLQLPPDIENEFKNYTKSYEAYKGNRTLNWRMVTGKVLLIVQFENRSIEYTVAPTQAIIIYHFQEKKVWKLEDLSDTMKIPPTILRRRMVFWHIQGLIKEIQPGVFSLIEETPEKYLSVHVQRSQLISEEEDVESAMVSARDQREEELQVFWSYIVGMLTNLDSLPLERIHQMLKLFASQGIGVEFSQGDLKCFLQRKVHEHKLIFSGGVYQLNK